MEQLERPGFVSSLRGTPNHDQIAAPDLYAPRTAPQGLLSEYLLLETFALMLRTGCAGLFCRHGRTMERPRTLSIDAAVRRFLLDAIVDAGGVW